MNSKRMFLKNLIAAFISQGVSMLLSVTMALIVPKLLGIKEYGYWQLFIFYVGYVGFFHLGFNDGVYLRLGGKNYDELDFEILGTEFRALIIFETIIAICISLIVFFIVDDPNRRYILLIASIYMIINNITLYFGYIFQAVNKTKLFSLSLIIDRIVVLVSIILLLFFQIEKYLPYIIAYTISKAISCLFCLYHGKKIVFSYSIKIKDCICDMWTSISIGIKLTFANIASILILGVGRIVIDNKWGIETFGIISFSLTLTNFFLLFIQQISMVLFPTLRQIDYKKLEMLYVRLRSFIGLFIPIVLVAYIPIKIILSVWLPQYEESIGYLAILLPICTFDGKMQMLYSTYLKVLREEKKLLQINLISLVISIILSVISGFVLKSLVAVAISMLLSITFRSVIAEKTLSYRMKIKMDKNLKFEILIVTIFILSTWVCSDLMAFLITLLSYLIFLYINRLEVKECIRFIENKIRR